MMITCPGLTVGNASKMPEARGLRSASRFVGACRTITAMLNFGRFCWNDRFRSTVINTSNCCSARTISRPLLMPAQPICGTVFTR